MRFILDNLIDRLERGESVVTGAVVRSSGSVPRTSGARMLVCEDGSLIGSVGGGAVEGACRKKANQLLASGEKYVQADFHMGASDAAADGMVCGGSVSVLLQRIEPGALEMLSQLRSGYRKGGRAVFITGLPDGANEPYIAVMDGSNSGDLPQELVMKIARKNRREPFLIRDNGRDLFVEPLMHPGVVHLVGAGHVARAVAHLAAFAGFEVVVMDDREEFANRERYPEAREIKVLDNFVDCLGNMGAEDYVVIVTRGHMHDRDVLAQALRTEAGYIGMIGSKKKRQAVYASLTDMGFAESDLARVYSPIGLSFGADTPEEIGFSIVAELIKVRSGSAG